MKKMLSLRNKCTLLWIAGALSAIGAMVTARSTSWADALPPAGFDSKTHVVGQVGQDENQQSGIQDLQSDKAAFARKTKRLHVPFIANNGQVDDRVKFYAKTFGGTVFVAKDGEIVYALPKHERPEEVVHRKGAKEKIEKPASHKDAKNTKERTEGGMDKLCLSVPPAENEALKHENDVFPALILANFVEFASLNPLYTSWKVPTAEENPSSIVNPDSNPKSAIQNPNSEATGVALREEFIGARINAIAGEGPSATKVNYFTGNDPEKWQTDVATYDFVNMGEIYAGIELQLKAYGDNVEKLFRVKPGADPERIRISLDGGKDFTVNGTGELEIETALGTVKFTRPVAYQEINGERVAVAVEYSVSMADEGRKSGSRDASNLFNRHSKSEIRHPKYETRNPNMSLSDFDIRISDFTRCVVFASLNPSYTFDSQPATSNSQLIYGFTVASYDRTKDLIVDPLLASTYLGGSKIDMAFALAVDSHGYVYVSGYTMSTDFPTTTGAYDVTSNNGSDDIFSSILPYYDCFVSKFDATLTTLLASTYLGGLSWDFADSIIIGQDENVYICGPTSSDNFPTTEGAYKRTRDGAGDAFVSKLDGSLSKLLASTYLGGSQYDGAFSLAPDADGNIYVAGSTGSTNFYTTANAYDTTYNGGSWDNFVTKLDSSLKNVLASTYLGTSGFDYYPYLAVGTDGSVFIAGKTDSKEFTTTTGAYQEKYNGGKYDVFVSKLDGTLTTLLASTYLGGSGKEEATDIALDAEGNVYVAGATDSTDYPTTLGAYLTIRCDSSSNAFISKLDKSLTNLLASTFSGGTFENYSGQIVLDPQGNVYVDGKTTPAEFYATEGAYSATHNGGRDGFISKMNGDLTRLLAFTFLGGAGDDFCWPLAIGADGSIFVAGGTDSSDFPTTSGAYQGNYQGGSYDVFVSRLDGDLSGLFSSGTPIKKSPVLLQTEDIGTTSPPITISSNSQEILAGQIVEITGVVTLTTDNETTRKRFLGETLKLVRINPDGVYEDVMETEPFLSKDQIHYTFGCVKLPAIGTWKLTVGFEAFDEFKGSVSDTIEVEVLGAKKKVAGYAILVEGRVEGAAGIDSHNLTINAVYGELLKRGFTGENMYYFNFHDTQDGVDKKPTRDGVLDAIKTWASGKMKEFAAPLYIVLAGHGKQDEFFIYPDDPLTAGDLKDALSSLKSQLKNKDAEKESLVVVLGFNHAGSFIGDLSGSGRIIIASSDTQEVSFKGPLAPGEEIRQGDYFVRELFLYASTGLNLRESYEKAAKEIAVFTENENGNGLQGASAGNGQYFDNSAQHPILDDDGDGVGSYGELSSLFGEEGELSTGLFVGFGTTSASLELAEVTDVITLDSDDPGPTLFAKLKGGSDAGKVWTEIAVPGHRLSYGADVTEQQVIELPRFSYNYLDIGQKYTWNDFSGNKEFDNFDTAGEYRVLYFAQDKTGEIAPFMESEVYRNEAGNKPPGDFPLISPANGTETAVALTFNWKDSVDSGKKTDVTENGDVTYTLMISEDDSFDTIHYQQKGLKGGVAVVDKEAGLHDGVVYYWKALASDAMGGTAFTKTSGSFKPKLANGFPGFAKGYIFDKDTKQKIAKAAGSVQGLNSPLKTMGNGAYTTAPLASGSYTLSVSADGYETATENVQVYGLKATTYNIGLTASAKTASISGVVKEEGSSALLEGVAIVIKKGGLSATAATDAGGSYTITGLESGQYNLTATKSGYKPVKKKVKLEIGKQKNLNVNMKKK